MKKKLAIALALALRALTCDPSVAMDENFVVAARLAQGPGNVTITGAGRIVMSQHQFYEPQISVVELSPDGATAPFPNAETNSRVSGTILA
ncbi:hypothetical protein WOC76_22705 [Methylocystis sp. IM3]|uniref:hypothetical protein n=1 Tax=unclassified Methylocystis TaxID=2625913 RepID=UPI0030F4F477